VRFSICCGKKDCAVRKDDDDFGGSQLTRWLWLIWLAVLGVVCLGGLLAWQRARHFERLFHLTRLDPLGLTAISNDRSPSARIVMFGDSRAAAWPPPDGFTMVNRGVPGHTSAQARLRYRLHVSPLKPELVIMQVGVNDLAALAILDDDDDSEAITQATIANLREMLTLARNDGSRVILTTIFPLGPNALERLDPSTSRITAAITRVNQAIHAMAAPDVIIFDSAAILADETGYVAEPFRDDLLHINAAGYRLLNERLVTLLRELE
jgi:lysophospholipase L1-like esterase